MIFNTKYFSLTIIAIKVLLLISNNFIYGSPLEKGTNLMDNDNVKINKRDSSFKITAGSENKEEREKKAAKKKPSVLKITTKDSKPSKNTNKTIDNQKSKLI
uniref:Uncharacterized protein n=1 Tax=Strongyloides venezuelensis TaxID=75913 RepID=A0A0K0FTV9_STRVS